MEYQDIYLTQLDEIIQLIKEAKIIGENEALQKFKLYLDNIESIGSFDLSNWRTEWRKQIWKFGELFQNQSPNQFLNIINEKLKTITISNKEVIEFIKSEIDFNFLPIIEFKKSLEQLVQEYPLNPEFRYAMGHCFSLEKDFLSALNGYKLAFKIDTGNTVFRETRFNIEQQYLNQLIDNGEYEVGYDYIQDLFSDTDFISWGQTRSTFVDFARRIKDLQLVQKKVTELEVEFKEKIHAELDHERRRLIEVLGFFAAIVVFILSTVSIGENFSFIEALYFIIALGIILILFVTSIYTIYSSDRTKLLSDKRFWILIVGLFLLFLLIIKADPISKLLEQLIK
jgi:tetratricopeptide (TPR) repeat protein